MIQRLHAAAAAAAKSLQSCPTLCRPRDGSPPGTPVPGTLQARTLEWVAISFSNAWKWKVKEKSLSHARLLATPWSAAYQAPPSMGFARQEYWSGLPLPSPLEPYIIVKAKTHRFKWDDQYKMDCWGWNLKATERPTRWWLRKQPVPLNCGLILSLQRLTVSQCHLFSPKWLLFSTFLYFTTS